MLPGKHPATVAKYGVNHYAATHYLWPDAFLAGKSRLFGQIGSFGLLAAILPFLASLAIFGWQWLFFGSAALDFCLRQALGYAGRLRD